MISQTSLLITKKNKRYCDCDRVDMRVGGSGAVGLACRVAVILPISSLKGKQALRVTKSFFLLLQPGEDYLKCGRNVQKK